jgi:hypothetical protein
MLHRVPHSDRFLGPFQVIHNSLFRNSGSGYIRADSPTDESQDA